MIEYITASVVIISLLSDTIVQSIKMYFKYRKNNSIEKQISLKILKSNCCNNICNSEEENNKYNSDEDIEMASDSDGE